MDSILSINNAGAKFGMKAITIAVSSLALVLSTSAASSANTQAVPPYPGKRVAGVSRSIKYPATPLNITALVPELDAKTSTKTTVKDLIVWVYVPYFRSDVNSDKNTFTLNLRVIDLTQKDTDGNPVNVTEREIALPEIPGIMPIYLPSGTQLKVGKSYSWELRAACENNAPFDIKLTIDRVAELSQSPLPTSQPLSKIGRC